MAVVEEKPKGYLVITVIEASGKNKNELYVWDAAEFEGYVKSTYAIIMHLAYQIQAATGSKPSKV
jgi:hypothetical protein